MVFTARLIIPGGTPHFRLHDDHQTVGEAKLFCATDEVVDTIQVLWDQSHLVGVIGVMAVKVAQLEVCGHRQTGAKSGQRDLQLLVVVVRWACLRKKLGQAIQLLGTLLGSVVKPRARATLAMRLGSCWRRSAPPGYVRSLAHAKAAGATTVRIADGPQAVETREIGNPCLGDDVPGG